MIEYKFHPHKDNPNVQVLDLTGNLDTASSEFLLDAVQGMIEDGYQNFVLNCRGLDYISSIGLGTLVRAKSRLHHETGNIALACVHGVIADAIHLVHFDRVFNLYETVDEAVAAITDA